MLYRYMLKYISLITITYCVIAHEDHSFDSTEISIQNRQLRSKHIYPNIPHRIKNPPTANQRSSSNFGSPVAVTDPADISHLLGQCSAGTAVKLASLFQGMFVSNSEAETMVTEAKSALGNSNSEKHSFIETNRISKTIGRANSGHNSPGGRGCCETEMRMTAPLTVLEQGKRMHVVHMNSSYQFVHEGVCANPRAKCRGFGECVQVYKYSYMLLYDPGLVNLFPPVRFGRIQVKSHCECMNIGT